MSFFLLILLLLCLFWQVRMIIMENAEVLLQSDAVKLRAAHLKARLVCQSSQTMRHILFCFSFFLFLKLKVKAICIVGYTTQPSVFCNLSECNKSENLHTVHYIHNTVCIPNMPMEYFMSKKQILWHLIALLWWETASTWNACECLIMN